jgi:hypothetical protein
MPGDGKGLLAVHHKTLPLLLKSGSQTFKKIQTRFIFGCGNIAGVHVFDSQCLRMVNRDGKHGFFYFASQHPAAQNKIHDLNASIQNFQTYETG